MWFLAEQSKNIPLVSWQLIMQDELVANDMVKSRVNEPLEGPSFRTPNLGFIPVSSIAISSAYPAINHRSSTLTHSSCTNTMDPWIQTDTRQAQ